MSEWVRAILNLDEPNRRLNRLNVDESLRRSRSRKHRPRRDDREDRRPSVLRGYHSDNDAYEQAKRRGRSRERSSSREQRNRSTSQEPAQRAASPVATTDQRHVSPVPRPRQIRMSHAGRVPSPVRAMPKPPLPTSPAVRLSGLFSTKSSKQIPSPPRNQTATRNHTGSEVGAASGSDVGQGGPSSTAIFGQVGSRVRESERNRHISHHDVEQLPLSNVQEGGSADQIQSSEEHGAHPPPPPSTTSDQPRRPTLKTVSTMKSAHSPPRVRNSMAVSAESISLGLHSPPVIHQRSLSAEDARTGRPEGREGPPPEPSPTTPLDYRMIQRSTSGKATPVPVLQSMSTSPDDFQSLNYPRTGLGLSGMRRPQMYPEPLERPASAYYPGEWTPQQAHPWSKPRASVALSGSTFIPPRSPYASSGVLGPKIFQYHPLDPTQSQFRLVKVLPKTTSIVKCEIGHYSLDDPPDYFAISYAWGDADDTEKIVLQGVTIPVTASLCGALGAVREKKREVLIWVDALCIDQQNREERTQQVRFMTLIYSKAVAVCIWLGPQCDNSDIAVAFLTEIARHAHSDEHITALLRSHAERREIPALVALFERDYWKRLWVVQEISNARERVVYCGSSKLPWDVYTTASSVFQRHKHELDRLFPGTVAHKHDQRARKSQFSYSQVLVYLGPSSFPDVASLMTLGEDMLLEVMRACREKLTADPRDKLYGILGVLPEPIRKEFVVDYNLSVKEVYIGVADYILHTTDRLDVICESIHFPVHTSSTSLPTWVPNWDYITTVTAMGRSFHFSASGASTAQFNTLDRQRKLRIVAIFLDTVTEHGISVGTLCTLADYLMAFLHWRALLLGRISNEDPVRAHEFKTAFCKTLCLNQTPAGFESPDRWLRACYHVFASLIRDRLPHLPLDAELQAFLSADKGIKPDERRQFLQQYFGSRIFGRCFCLTANRLLGMGSGFMAADDIIVVPLGCSTPVILRPEGKGEYRFVGDVYIHGYMEGRAWEEFQAGQKELREYVLH